MYLILPETENISLEDIERHFSDNTKKITDRNIVKSNKTTPSKDLEDAVKITEKPFENVTNEFYDNQGMEINCEKY